MSVKKMSQSMRDGAKLRKGVIGRLCSHQGTCALGAAIEGEFGLTNDVDWLHDEVEAGDKLYRLIEETWPISMKKAVCPGKCCATFCECHNPNCLKPHRVKSTVKLFVIHLNDSSRWTREAIADWIETLENEEDAAQSKLKHMSTKEMLDVMLEGHPNPTPIAVPVDEIIQETIQLKANKNP